jgi:hypothetical protein
MAAASYESALQIASSLSREEQLRLIEELSAPPDDSSAEPQHSILELRGLGKELWSGIDVKQYLKQERESWNG